MRNRRKIIFWTILVLNLMNCGVVFATGLTITKTEKILKSFLPSWTLTSTQINKFEECINNYDYVTFIEDMYNAYYFYFYDDTPIINPRNSITFKNYRRLKVDKDTPSEIWDDTGSSINHSINTKYSFYTESGFYDEGTETYNPNYLPGTTNIDVIDSASNPYFEFSEALVSNVIKITYNTNNIKYFDGFNYELYIQDGSALGTYYGSIDKLVNLYIHRYNIDSNLSYDESKLIYSKYNDGFGYLEYDSKDTWHVKYPISFMKPNYIYILSFGVEESGVFDSDSFYIYHNSDYIKPSIPNPENPGAGDDTEIGGIIEISSGDVDNILDKNNQITPDDLENSIGEINQTIKDTVGNIEFNESGNVAESSGIMGGIWDIISNFFGWIWDFLFRLDEEQLKTLLDQIQAQMEETHSLLSIPLHILNESLSIFKNADPQDFILSWEKIDFQGITLIEAGSFNINKFVNSNEKFKEIYDYYIIIISAGWIYIFANWLRALYLDILSIEWLGNKVEEEIILQETHTYFWDYGDEQQTAMTHNNKTGMTEHNPRRRVVHYGKKGKDYWVE